MVYLFTVLISGNGELVFSSGEGTRETFATIYERSFCVRSTARAVVIANLREQKLYSELGALRNFAWLLLRVLGPHDACFPGA